MTGDAQRMPAMVRYKTDLTTRPLPGIARAALEMAYCNGGINRERSEADVLRLLDRMPLPPGGGNLSMIDAWLGGLNYIDLLIVVDGYDDERRALLAAAPEGAEALLQTIFEHAA